VTVAQRPQDRTALDCHRARKLGQPTGYAI
jgi:hypothetical protein